MASMNEDNAALLEREYCPPIDPALLTAIISDFDLSKADEIKLARETLDSIKASALEEESSGFDPSGSAHLGDVEDNAVSEKGDSAGASTADTTLTSLSNGVRSLGFSEADSEGASTEEAAGRSRELNKQDVTSKVILLQEMFPDMNAYTIKHTLNKCGDDWERTMEELLNHAFFNDQSDGFMDGEEKPSMRSVDAFVESSNGKKSRKKEKRKGRSLELERHSAHSSASPSPAPAPHTSAWQNSKKDVEFLSERLNLSTTTITSLYHQHSLSLQKTMVALLESPALIATSTITPSDPVAQAHSAELLHDFPSLGQHHAMSLIRLTHPSTVSAHELAKALTAGPYNRSAIEVVFQHTPPNLSDDDDLSSSSRQRTPRDPRLPMPYVPHTGHMDSSTLTSTYNASASNAFNQASSAYRRARSDKLMSGAAAYYSQLGRDYASLRSEASAGAADELVAAQSPRPKEEIDLHGVTVKDAVRIAKSKTESWWKSVGGRGIRGMDGRVERGSGGSFRIVTGLGRHSEGGRGKLGPAVSRALLADGWRVSVGDGVVTVSGKGR